MLSYTWIAVAPPRWPAATARRPKFRLVVRAAVLMVTLLSLAAGGLSAQARTIRKERKRTHRIFAAQTGPDQVTLAWDQVPGTTEYRIYLATPDMQGPPPPTTRPTITVGGTSGQAFVQGVQRLAHGAYLVAVGPGGDVLYQGTFNPVTRGSPAPVAAPAGVQVRQTGPNEVTVSWTPVPGATAYMIGRGVGPAGLSMACHICPPEAEYVDTAAVPGLEHVYTVQAWGPTGVSARTISSRFLVDAGQLAAAPPAPPAAGVPAKPMDGGAPVPGTPADASNAGAGPPAADTATTPPTTGTTRPSSTVTPPGTPAGADTVPPLVNPQIPPWQPSTEPPVIGQTPVGAESLDTPPADTGRCVSARAEPTQADSTERIDPRADRIGSRTTTNPDAAQDSWAAVTTTNLGSADYREGRCLNPGVITGYPDLWDPVASASGMTSAEVVAAWQEIGIVALEYRHILGRAPTPAETRRDVAALKAGLTWRQLWRQLAHSAERDTRFGYYAAAPIPDSAQARGAFGTAVAPWTTQQCYGAIGPRCDGIPQVVNMVNSSIQPYWFGAFRMPDNTELAYVEIGVNVGSVLHDNACLKDKGGTACDGYSLLGDLVKTDLIWPATLEWNKAAWNLIDNRSWRGRFGPYPTDPRLREREWYDDLRPAASRPTMMAPVLSVFAWPGLTVTYTGGETRQTRALQAPAGVSLDATDVAYCQSGRFSSTGSFLGKAPWGICAAGTAVVTSTDPHAATPVTTTPPTTSPPTTTQPTGTTPPASCRLDYQRADNMWAAFGRPDGFLGVESITLAAGVQKVFITDWKYEKQRNDGVTYYGSHLRVATNASSRPIRLQLMTAAGAVTSWERLEPNTTRAFQADLQAVHCEP